MDTGSNLELDADPLCDFYSSGCHKPSDPTTIVVLTDSMAMVVVDDPMVVLGPALVLVLHNYLIWLSSLGVLVWGLVYSFVHFQLILLE